VKWSKDKSARQASLLFDIQLSDTPPTHPNAPPPAVQFVAFFSVAFVAYFMRTRHGYRSLAEAIYARYGGFAALAFGLAVAYR